MDARPNELITIIIPVYNVQDFLERCIDSVINQTYRELQIILVNDGSTDGSLDICKIYVMRDPRIEIHDKKNGGLSDARNAGLARAKGAYVAFVDSDDYIHRRYIEIMYDSIKRDRSDMCICAFHFVYQGGEDPVALSRQPDRCEFHLNGSHDSQTVMKTISNTHLVMACNKLCRIGLFNDIRFPIGRLHEDEFILHRLIGSCNCISMRPEKLYFYYQHPSSIMNLPYTAGRLDVLDAYADRMDYYLKNRQHSLIKCTCLGYIRRYVEACVRLPMNVAQNALRLKECAIKFRSYGKIMFKHGGLAIGLRFVLAAASPGCYNRFSKCLKTLRPSTAGS